MTHVWKPLILGALLLALAGCDLLDAVLAPNPNKDPILMADPIPVEVPAEVQFRANAFLEDARTSENAPGWADAQLNGEVRPLYRPDVDGVAYYEFAVEPQGFIVVSTGRHDFPVPHWDPFGMPISHELQKLAQQPLDGLRLYKLDTLYYAAEDAAGQRVAELGTPIVRIDGMQMGWLDDHDHRLSGVIVHPEREVPDDEQIEGVEFVEERSGSQETSPITFEAWESWQALKNGYTLTYAVFLEQLRREAAAAWDAEEETATILSAEGTPVAASHTGWTPWQVRWAGDFQDQRNYYQPVKVTNTIFGKARCPSGCGATAWAMLFGWADHQAERGNRYWAPRWGLYRENGGYGANADAPQHLDAGVENMTWDIAGRMATLCAFGQTATHPDQMQYANSYFKGRTGTTMEVNSNWFGVHALSLHIRARDSILNRNTPAIIGTGWLSHYPLAFGYDWRCRTNDPNNCVFEFYVNQGWGGGGNGWIPAGTWFSGEIRP